MWWKLYSAGYVNGDRVARLSIEESTNPVGWLVKVVDGANVTLTLAGVHTTEAEAEEVARRLVHGIDPEG